MMKLEKDGYAQVAEKTVENLVIKKGRCDLAKIRLNGATKLKRGHLLYDWDEGDFLDVTRGSHYNAHAILAEDLTVEEGAEFVTAEVFFSGTFYARGIISQEGLTHLEIKSAASKGIFIEASADYVVEPARMAIYSVTNATTGTANTVCSEGNFIVNTSTNLEWNKDAEEEGFFMNLGGQKLPCEIVSTDTASGVFTLTNPHLMNEGDKAYLLFRTSKLTDGIVSEIEYKHALSYEATPAS